MLCDVIREISSISAAWSAKKSQTSSSSKTIKEINARTKTGSQFGHFFHGDVKVSRTRRIYIFHPVYLHSIAGRKIAMEIAFAHVNRKR